MTILSALTMCSLFLGASQIETDMPQVIPYEDQEECVYQVDKEVRRALRAMGVHEADEIAIERTEDGSCSNDSTIWIQQNQFELGPQEFVIYHEAAHVACGHYRNHCNVVLDGGDLTLDMLKGDEIEADLIAAHTLCSLNKHHILEQRINEIDFALSHGWMQVDTHDHPTLEEMREYLSGVLETAKAH
jgi:hypothetical protein